MKPSRRTIAIASLALSSLLAAAPTVSFACGYHDPLILAQGMLNWSYPEALHVTGSVWSAQKAGILEMPDRGHLVAVGPERERLNKEAFLKASRAINALGDALGTAETRDEGRKLSLVLIEPMLWTRYVHTGEYVEVEPHRTNAEVDDLVIVTDVPVLHAIDDGTLSIGAAKEKGLLRLYGTPEQKSAFMDAYGTIGEEPLPEAEPRNPYDVMMNRGRLARDEERNSDQ